VFEDKDVRPSLLSVINRVLGWVACIGLVFLLLAVLVLYFGRDDGVGMQLEQTIVVS